MAYFTKGTWTDRAGTSKNKRTLTDVDTNQSASYTIQRQEGTVYKAGTLFNNSTMDDIETRIKNAFDAVETAIGNISSLVDSYFPVGSLYLAYDNITTSQLHDLLGGTWSEVYGGALMPADNLPDNMIGNLQYEGENNKVITHSATAHFESAGGTTELAYADCPNHAHTYADLVPDADIMENVFFSGKHKNGLNVTDNVVWTHYNLSTAAAGTGAGHRHNFTGGASVSFNDIGVNVEQPGIAIRVFVRTA